MAAGQCVEPAGGRWYDFCRQSEKRKKRLICITFFCPGAYCVKQEEHTDAERSAVFKVEQNAELSGESVHISDLGKLYCKTQSVQNRCRTLPVFRFEEKDKGRRVVSALFVISLLQQDNPNLEVESIGAPETVVEQVKVSRYPGLWQVCKIVFVCCICFLAQRLRSWRFITTSGFARCSGKFTSS